MFSIFEQLAFYENEVYKLQLAIYHYTAQGEVEFICEPLRYCSSYTCSLSSMDLKERSHMR